MSEKYKRTSVQKIEFVQLFIIMLIKLHLCFAILANLHANVSHIKENLDTSTDKCAVCFLHQNQVMLKISNTYNLKN